MRKSFKEIMQNINMFKEQMPLEQIAKFTGLSLEEIEKLIEEK